MSLCDKQINVFFVVFLFFVIFFVVFLLSLCDLCVVLHSSSCCGSVCLLVCLLEVASKVGILRNPSCFHERKSKHSSGLF